MTSQYQQPGINNPGDALSVTADRQLTTDYELIVITGGTPTLTLPDARVVRGIVLEIKSVTGTGVINTLSAQTIDGAGTFSFSVAQQALAVISDGSNWRIINNFGQAPSAVTGTGRPTASANFIGQIYLDTAHGNRAYLATSVGNGEGDWKRTSAFDPRYEMAPIFEDFADQDAVPGGWSRSLGVGGSYTTASDGPQLYHPGVGVLSVTNALNDYSVISNNRFNFVFGGGEAFNKWIVNIPTEAAAANPYTARWGYIDTITNAAPTDAVYWRISETSGNLIAMAMESGNPSSVDTGISYDFGVNYHDYSIRINALGTSAEFFLDGVSVATVGGIPQGTAEVFGVGAQLVKTAAIGGAITLRVDLCNATQDIDIARAS